MSPTGCKEEDVGVYSRRRRGSRGVRCSYKHLAAQNRCNEPPRADRQGLDCLRAFRVTRGISRADRGKLEELEREWGESWIRSAFTMRLANRCLHSARVK